MSKIFKHILDNINDIRIFTNIKDAVNKFKEGFNCAQAVIFSYSDKFDISKDLLVVYDDIFVSKILKDGIIFK